MKAYFYSNTKNNEKKDKYTVYEVEVIDDDLDVAERRCRTIARKHNDTLVGGYFKDKYLPYNFKEDYTIIKVPLNTRVSPYNKKDKFIMGIIEAESNMEFQVL
jgi:hypothetical protein